ncbi:hypothetical protein GGS21DRAFT_492138 [Xylaria nigripes]|nr:hypothetical protein GGS21DRAFT_492138 [Xylaria nigripes]
MDEDDMEDYLTMEECEELFETYSQEVTQELTKYMPVESVHPNQRQLSAVNPLAPARLIFMCFRVHVSRRIIVFNTGYNLGYSQHGYIPVIYLKVRPEWVFKEIQQDFQRILSCFELLRDTFGSQFGFVLRFNDDQVKWFFPDTLWLPQEAESSDLYPYDTLDRETLAAWYQEEHSPVRKQGLRSDSQVDVIEDYLHMPHRAKLLMDEPRFNMDRGKYITLTDGEYVEDENYHDEEYDFYGATETLDGITSYLNWLSRENMFCAPADFDISVDEHVMPSIENDEVEENPEDSMMECSDKGVVGDGS